MSKSDYEAAATNVAELLTRIESAIKVLSADPRNWWRNRKKYSRLSENIIKSYVLSKLRDVRMKGRAEADRFIEKQILGKKTDFSSEILSFMSKNRGIWADFIYKVAATQDIEALTGFFVPFIYGGLISRKNMTGEAFGVVEFGKNDSKIPQSERIMNAIRAIDGLKRQGISVILIEGRPNTIYSRQMLSMYRGSPSEAFIIIEREEKEDNAALESGKSTYDREILSELCAAKNVFILLDPKNSEQTNSASSCDVRTVGKSRALLSYGILHGTWRDFGDSLDVSGKKGSGLIVFDCKMSLNGVLGGALTMPKRTDEIFDLIPRPIVDFLTSPSLPIRLPSLYELLIPSQFILTAGKMREIRREIV